jgi:isoaspartyl peptidase/L-asparaginase-like protein (Ntn-hydrolase superfamily)
MQRPYLTLFCSTWGFGKTACEAAWQHWERHGDLAAAVEAGIVVLELDPSVNSVGVGGLPNADGVVELDAAFMVGADLDCGAVAGVKNVAPAISLAVRVLRDTEHVMLVGAEAEAFALSHGFPKTDLMTDAANARYREWLVDRARGVDRDPEDDSHDTVGLIGWHKGKGVVGCSTSGYAWKLPGRVGDSPIVGAGLYADDEVGAVVATGYGEDIWRFCMSAGVIERMRKGMTAQEACEHMVTHMCRRRPVTAERRTAVMAVRRDGLYGAASTLGNFPAQFMVDGRLETVVC